MRGMLTIPRQNDSTKGKAMADSPVWKTVLGELELSESKANFKTWLKPTKLVSIENKVALISVPNIFIKNWLDSHYKAQFLTAFQKQGEEVKEVRFEIEGSQEVIGDEFTETETPVMEMVEAPAAEAPTTILSHYTFDTFVEGNHNRLAYNVSATVAKSPGTLYNPLFIYGGVGLGKTHLMHAIANEITHADPKKKVLYVSCEQFTNDYIQSISTRNMEKFKKIYRTVDLLLVDDIQFLSNKEGSQEEFFNTFNTLHQSKRQIVLAADRMPSAITGLEERLSSRFGWGMIVDIQPPNLETRAAILASKCQDRGVVFPQEALAFIASRIQSNIRELEGALNRAITYCQMMHVPYSLESVQAALSGLVVPINRRTSSPESVVRLVAQQFGITHDELIGSKRNKELVYPRQLAMYLLRNELNLSFPQIARELGGKDHTTIMYGYKKIQKEVPSNSMYQQDISSLKEKIQAAV